MMCSISFLDTYFFLIHFIQNGKVYKINDQKAKQSKEKQNKILPPIRVCLSDNTILSKNHGAPKKFKFTFS